MTVADPYDDIDIPDVGLPEFLFSDLSEHADSVAVIDGPSGREMTSASWRTGSTGSLPRWASAGWARATSSRCSPRTTRTTRWSSTVGSRPGSPSRR